MKKFNLVFSVLAIFLSNPSSASLDGEGKHSLTVGVGQISLYRDYEDHGESGLIPTLSYSYEREKKYFPIVEIHHYKNNFRDTYFSTSSINFSLGYNYLKVDSFYLSPLVGLGFYLPRARRSINGQLFETESKAVFGASLGLDTLLKLNDHYGIGFKYQLHAPFSIKQVVGEELEGHYSTLTIGITFII